VFLPGLSEIQTLFELLQTSFKNSPNFLIIPLHSVLSSENQTFVFKTPPKGVRKIVLSTNIAETGVTIPDIVFVIDTGKVKETHYQPTKRMTCLQEGFVSKVVRSVFWYLNKRQAHNSAKVALVA
jgi:HrpA-like RNA helicase